MLKVNDVIKVSASTSILDVPEDVMKIKDTDYKREYSISYFLNDTFIASVDFEDEVGFSSYNGIKDFIEEDLPHSFEEIKKYEIFDIDETDYEYQTAKIRVVELN